MQRVAVVTGGSSGIGAAVARRLARDGWRCVLLARGADRLRAVADEIGGESEPCDVGDRAAVEAVAARVRARHPEIALLVNGAGVPGRKSFLTAEPERIEAVMRTNYLGSVWCARAFLPALRQAAPADIVNVVSVAGTVAFAPSGPYSASKFAQLAFSRSLASELAPWIRVHTINPGFVETEGFPQRGRLRNPLVERTVIEPDVVASRIVRAIGHRPRERFVPRGYRLAAIVQALAPNLLARAVAWRGGYRDTPA